MQYLSRPLFSHFLLLSLLSGSVAPLNSSCHSLPHQELWITIFVHGIMGIAPHVNLQNIGLFVRDQLIDTVYARAVHRMRKNDYFFQDQAMQKLGLIPIDITQAHVAGNGSALCAYLYDCIDAHVHQNRHENVFYTYGWSGLLSRRQRYIESEGLLLGVYHLIELYKLKGVTPKIRLIGYSHGGNVCLNMGHMYDLEYHDMPIHIDELVLIGTPIQIETDKYCASPLFDRVYNIFSNQDIAQKMDFFSTYKFFSDRQFTSRRSFKVPKKVTQINLKVSRLAKTTLPLEKQKSLCKDGLKTTTRSGKRRLLRDASPGHLELWFFGWTNDKYRLRFPLYPFPAVLFIPYLINIAHQYHYQICNPYPCTIDLRPELEYTIVSYSKAGYCFAEQIPFINKELLDHYREIALSAVPTNIENDTYQEEIRRALEAACKEYDTCKQPIVQKSKKGRRRRYDRKNQHKKARALPNHYKFLEPLS